MRRARDDRGSDRWGRADPRGSVVQCPFAMSLLDAVPPTPSTRPSKSGSHRLGLRAWRSTTMRPPRIMRRFFRRFSLTCAEMAPASTAWLCTSTGLRIGLAPDAPRAIAAAPLRGHTASLEPAASSKTHRHVHRRDRPMVRTPATATVRFPRRAQDQEYPGTAFTRSIGDSLAESAGRHGRARVRSSPDQGE